MDDKTKNLTRDDIESLTSMQTAKMRGVEFAGFLVREDDNAIYVADPQGTWMIPRESCASLGPWTGGSSIPEDMRSAGKPVRVRLKEDSIFYEIRPWRVSSDPASPNQPPPITIGNVRQIFSLANGPQQLTPNGLDGEALLQQLENQLSRQLGFNPDVFSDPSVFPGGGSVACGTSATSDQDSNGTATRSDTDGDF